MSSGNPCGLSEISHFGTFQRVGGKAGGFISKKFFHPSSFRNQEKLWKAQTADERQRRKQIELEKRREEERQVEELRKQMYLAGQGKSGDFLSSTIQVSDQDIISSEKTEQLQAFEELKRRKALLKHEQCQKASQADEVNSTSQEAEHCSAAEVSGQASSSSGMTLAKSRYNEDTLVQGHNSVWGSWYETSKHLWGFACCKSVDRAVQCPLAEAVIADHRPAVSPKDEPRGRKRRRDLVGEGIGDRKGERASATTAAASTEARTLTHARHLLVEGDVPRQGGGTPAALGSNEPLISCKLLEAAARRQDRSKQEKEEKDDQSSRYLADLLQEPALGR